MELHVKYLVQLLIALLTIINFGSMATKSVNSKFRLNKNCHISNMSAIMIYKNYTTSSNIRCASSCSSEENCLSYDSCNVGEKVLCRLRNGYLDECPSSQLNAVSCLNYEKDNFEAEPNSESTAVMLSTVSEVRTSETTVVMLSTVSEVNPCKNNGTYESGSGICTCQLGCSGTTCSSCFTDCQDGTDAGMTGISVSYIHPPTADEAFQISCNFDYGINYIQYRKYGNVNFNRSWSEYRDGFGDLNGDFWLGNKYIYALSNYKSYSMSVRLYYSGAWNFYSYANFQLLNESQKYVINYNPTYFQSNDGLAPADTTKDAAGQTFKTYDDDITGCSSDTGSGWWFNSGCSISNVNGPFPVTWGSVTSITQTGIALH